MNEKLLKILEQAYDAATKTGDFVIQEGGILIQQFLLWKTFENVFYILLGVFFMVVIPLFLRSLFKKIDPDDPIAGCKFLGRTTRYDWDDILPGVAAFVTTVSVIIGFVMIINHSLNLIKLLVAPNVYLLEYILDKI